MDKITVGIASMPYNEAHLKRTIESLYHHVDRIIVGLNLYKEVPHFLKREKIESHLLDNSTGDAAKFLKVDEISGYYFSCDDDLIYNENYIPYMIEKIEQYGRSALITLHGRIMKDKVESYYRDHKLLFNCLTNNARDVLIDIGGSGVAAFHTDTAKVSYKDFIKPNMADIYLSYLFSNIVCAKHSATFLTYQPHEKNICATYRNNDGVQTKEYNRLKNEKRISNNNI